MFIATIKLSQHSENTKALWYVPVACEHLLVVLRPKICRTLDQKHYDFAARPALSLKLFVTGTSGKNVLGPRSANPTRSDGPAHDGRGWILNDYQYKARASKTKCKKAKQDSQVKKLQNRKNSNGILLLFPFSYSFAYDHWSFTVPWSMRNF